MVGRFCPECGETRWHLFAVPPTGGAKTCPLCDGALRPERRQPGRAGRFAAERRAAVTDARAPSAPVAPPGPGLAA
jgi:hypothetical protein